MPDQLTINFSNDPTAPAVTMTRPQETKFCGYRASITVKSSKGTDLAFAGIIRARRETRWELTDIRGDIPPLAMMELARCAQTLGERWAAIFKQERERAELAEKLRLQLHHKRRELACSNADITALEVELTALSPQLPGPASACQTHEIAKNEAELVALIQTADE